MDILRERLQSTTIAWMKASNVEWGLCCCWHTPNAMNAFHRRWDHYWLSSELKRHFNRVDRRVLKAAHTNRSMRIPRFITLEYAEGTGWHAHGLIGIVNGFTIQELRLAYEKDWLKATDRFATGKFEKRLFWAEEKEGGYDWYLLQDVYGPEFKETGITDLDNIYIP